MAQNEKFLENKTNKIIFYFILAAIMLLGFYLRFKGYLANPSFWHDECALAWNIKFKSYAELFGILRFLQVTPPLFSVATKALTQFFGFSELVFRFIPFVCGCLSIILFYFLCNKSFNNKFTIVCAVFLFAINQRLINFSFEFKPYSIDVFMTIVCLLFFANMNIEKLTKIKVFLSGLFLAFVPWFSFVSVFTLGGGFLNLLLTDIKKNLPKKVALTLPFLLSVLIYLSIYLFKNYTGTHMVSDWQDYFVTLNPVKFIYLLAESIRYLMFPIKLILFAIILFFTGIFLFYRENFKVFKICFLSFFCFLVASFFHIYPFSNRVILFLTPIYLLFMLKPLDLVSIKKKLKSLLLIILILLTFYPQIQWLQYYVSTSKMVSKGGNSREMTKALAKELEKGDIVWVSNFSNTEFAYYSSFYNIKNEIMQEPQKADRIEFLNSIKKGNNCWFFLTYDNPKPILEWIDKNADIIKIIHSKGLNDYLIYTHIKNK